ncbi:hypothetical protein D9M73_125410 [compost metagenome]
MRYFGASDGNVTGYLIVANTHGWIIDSFFIEGEPVVIGVAIRSDAKSFPVDRYAGDAIENLTCFRGRHIAKACASKIAADSISFSVEQK